VRKVQPTAPLYLCRKAAEGDSSAASQPSCPAYGHKNGDQWIVTAPESQKARSDFYQRYHQHFDVEPGIGAAEACDAVRILAASLRHSGPNRARLRDELAGVSAFAGASGIISFDHAGNDTSQVTLVKLK
jgi:ABC-type branched-subunit amino acid transport system substrate-binding protein